MEDATRGCRDESDVGAVVGAVVVGDPVAAEETNGGDDAAGRVRVVVCRGVEEGGGTAGGGVVRADDAVLAPEREERSVGTERRALRAGGRGTGNLAQRGAEIGRGGDARVRDVPRRRTRRRRRRSRVGRPAPSVGARPARSFALREGVRKSESKPMVSSPSRSESSESSSLCVGAPIAMATGRGEDRANAKRRRRARVRPGAESAREGAQSTPKKPRASSRAEGRTRKFARWVRRNARRVGRRASRHPVASPDLPSASQRLRAIDAQAERARRVSVSFSRPRVPASSTPPRR